VLVASKRSLSNREGVLEITHEMLERLEAHLRATGEIMVDKLFCILFIL
jgi:ATP phosphoribosyltransferase